MPHEQGQHAHSNSPMTKTAPEATIW